MGSESDIDHDIALHWYRNLSKKDREYIRDLYFPYPGGMLHSAIISAYRDIKKVKRKAK